MTVVARVRSDDRIYDIVELTEPYKKYVNDDRIFTHVITPGCIAWGTSLLDAIAVTEDMIKMQRHKVKEIILF